MIALILMSKIASLFIIMLCGFTLVRIGIVRAEESKVISLISIYLLMPCVLISAFQVDYNDEIRNGLLLTIGVSILLHIGMLILNKILEKTLHFDALEQVSVMYSNAGNLIIPLVTSVLGPEMVIYTSGFLMVQLFLLWSHGRSTLCGEKGIDLKKIFTNINIIMTIVGVFFFYTGIRLPGPVADAVGSISGMVGPSAMIVTGMLIAGTDLKKILSYKRAFLVTAVRLVVIPVLSLLLIKCTGVAHLVPNGEMVLLVTLLATMTPSASTVTQLSQVYGQDAEYASTINVMSTLLCIITMPVMVYLYQL